MAKKKTTKKKSDATVTVKVYFHPHVSRTPVKLELEFDSDAKKGPFLCNCKHEKFLFYCFRDMITENDTLMAVPMIVPFYFSFEHLDKKYSKKFEDEKKDVRALFLLKVTASMMGDDSCIKDFFEDRPKHHGTQGCPPQILITNETYTDEYDTSGESTEEIEYSMSYFKFNNMRFYPFLLREFTVGYFVCDEHAKHLHWRAFKKETFKGIGVDEQVVYDATLGLFVTRNAKFVMKQES